MIVEMVTSWPENTILTENGISPPVHWTSERPSSVTGLDPVTYHFVPRTGAKALRDHLFRQGFAAET